MNTPDLPKWVTQAKDVLDDSARDLDGATLSRLNRARHAALEQRPARSRSRIWWIPAGVASACVLLLAVAIWQRPFSSVNPANSGAAALSGSDADIVSGDDTLEFYQDLDFYAWLDAQQDNDNG